MKLSKVDKILKAVNQDQFTYNGAISSVDMARILWAMSYSSGEVGTLQGAADHIAQSIGYANYTALADDYLKTH